MTRPDVLSTASRVLGDHAKQLEPGAPSRDERQEIVAAMQARLRARVVQERRRMWIGRSAVAAGVIVSALAGRYLLARQQTSLAVRAPAANEIVAHGRLIDGAATAWHQGLPKAVGFDRLASGDRLVTASDGRAEIALSTGTSVVVAPAADVTFTQVARAQTFALTAGSVNARVAKLHEGERFLVRTADTEVEVRGTVFEVAVVPSDPSCGEGTTTRVSVTEGVVVVRNHGEEVRVAAGEHWPVGCAAPKPLAAPSASSAAAAPNGAPSASACATPSGSAAAAPPQPTRVGLADPSAGPLASQNDLFDLALAAKYRGDLEGALAGFERYLGTYPTGEHVESASVQRMRILAKLDRGRAVEAAKAYLAQHPKGFARDEAEALANGTP
jgi:TolA-binding protein